MIKIEGLDKLKNELKSLEKNAKRLHGSNDVSFDELFSSKFMSSYTNHSNFEALLEAGGYSVETQEDFEAIPEDDWDSHIREHTRFETWLDMQQKAAEEWITKQLGF